MSTYLDTGEVLIGDHTPIDHPVLTGGGRGLIPRDFALHPAGSYAAAPHTAIDLPTIDQSEWANRLALQTAARARCSDLRLRANNGQPFPSLNQGQVGYCWAHSTTHAVMYVRAGMGLLYVPLSAYAVAATIKHGADEGGWGALSLDFAADKGIPSQARWPQGDRDYRRYDTPEVWADAALHKVTAQWADLDSPQYDRTLSFAQRATLWLSGRPTVDDYNWWGHSVCGIDLVNGSGHRASTRAESGKLLQLPDFDLAWGMNDPVTGGFGCRIQNSWGDEWSDRGMGVLSGSKCQADGCVAPRGVTANN